MKKNVSVQVAYIYIIPFFSILGREAIFDISKCVICACAVRTNFKTKDFFLFLHFIDKFTYLFFLERERERKSLKYE